MKALNEKREEKSTVMKDKLKEKEERLKELEKKNNQERKLIIKKLERMQQKKNELDRLKEEKLVKLRNLRDSKFERMRTNKSAIEEREKKRRENILFDEEEKFDRALNRENKNDSIKSNSRHKTIGLQKSKEEKMKYFLKEMNLLKNQSIMKKNERQKKQMYIAKLRKEAEEDICYICEDKLRNKEILCVVEDPKTVISIEKLGIYNGYYHVLNGLIQTLDGINPEDIRLDKLIKRIEDNKFKEIIIAVKPCLEGEMTALYINNVLNGMNIEVSRLASGIPMGADMEYIDPITLEKAFDNRKKLS